MTRHVSPIWHRAGLERINTLKKNGSFTTGCWCPWSTWKTSLLDVKSCVCAVPSVQSAYFEHLSIVADRAPSLFFGFDIPCF